MSDTQLLTIAIAIVFPLGMLLYSNSRVSEAKETIRAEVRAETQTLRTEIQQFRADIMLVLQRLENKIDHVEEVLADHSGRLDRLEHRASS